MTTPVLLADLDAVVVKRVLPFAAHATEVRYYLQGMHVVPGKPVRLECTNGHMLYAEEDKSAVVTRELVIRLGARGRGLLRTGHRVKVYDDKVLRITDSYGVPLYVEPEPCVIEYAFPQIQQLVGNPAQWHEGLRAPCNTQYLLTALRLPGAIRFFSSKDAAGQFSLSSSVMFVMDGGTGNGGKAMGLIMPMRSRFDERATVADMLPLSLLPAAGATRQAA